jgi:dihydrofolate reductase
VIKIVMAAAVGENGVIGVNNELPWRLKSDLKHFRAITIHKPVVMGRKTFLSIGKPLKDRTNIVVSRNKAFTAAGIEVAGSIDAAMEMAREDAQRRGADEIVIIGGSDLFTAFMPRADRLEITHVHAAPAGDVFFPSIDPAVWRETARHEVAAGPDDTAAFAIATYMRR